MNRFWVSFYKLLRKSKSAAHAQPALPHQPGKNVAALNCGALFAAFWEARCRLHETCGSCWVYRSCPVGARPAVIEYVACTGGE